LNLPYPSIWEIICSNFSVKISLYSCAEITWGASAAAFAAGLVSNSGMAIKRAAAAHMPKIRFLFFLSFIKLKMGL
jgi:hypothetical protein